jgi:hypothetical protein
MCKPDANVSKQRRKNFPKQQPNGRKLLFRSIEGQSVSYQCALLSTNQVALQLFPFRELPVEIYLLARCILRKAASPRSPSFREEIPLTPTLKIRNFHEKSRILPEDALRSAYDDCK